MRFKFGDLVENGWASDDNPTRVGVFVRRGCRTGRMNPGPYAVLTDMKGKFWEVFVRDDSKLTIVGNVLDPTREGER